jgi:hypothetical protein
MWQHNVLPSIWFGLGFVGTEHSDILLFLMDHFCHKDMYFTLVSHKFRCKWKLVGFMVFNATFNNISVISWRSVLLVSQVTDKLDHIMLYTSPWSRFELTISVVIGTDRIGSCKSNYHTITATTALCKWRS